MELGSRLEQELRPETKAEAREVFVSVSPYFSIFSLTLSRGVLLFLYEVNMDAPLLNACIKNENTIYCSYNWC